MEILNNNEEITLTKEDYNNEPVYYCSSCLSLLIRELDNNICFCDECGDTDIKTSHIEEWEKLYIEKYGKPLINLK